MIKVFSMQWFRKYQSLILWVARNKYLGEFVFNFRKMGHYVDREMICGVTPFSVCEYIGTKDGKIEMNQHFFIRNEYALRLQHLFYPIWFLFHCWDTFIANNFCPKLNLGFDTLTVYPASTRNTSPTSDAIHRSNRPSWTDAHDTADGTGITDNCVTNTSYAKTYHSMYGYSILRGLLCFDTSSLTSSASISDATVSLYVSDVQDGDNDGDDWLNIVSATPASTQLAAVGDFDAIGDAVNNPTEGATRIDLGSISTGAYKDWTLNTYGKGLISKTAVTTLGIREGHDCINSSIADNTIDGITANNGHASSNKPRLVVTFTVPLLPGTGYRVRAYATNSAGTGYGTTVQLTTLSDAMAAFLLLMV